MTGSVVTGATVLAMSDHRAVFVLPEAGGTAVFIASRGPKPRLAHQRHYGDPGEASVYAAQLAERFGCVVVGGDLRCRGAGHR